MIEPDDAALATEVFDYVSGQVIEEDPNELHCICRQPSDGRFMICCDQCEMWFHIACLGLEQRVAEKLEEYLCSKCGDKGNICQRCHLIGSETLFLYCSFSQKHTPRHFRTSRPFNEALIICVIKPISFSTLSRGLQNRRRMDFSKTKGSLASRQKQV
jgi:hypothetical protein